MAFQARTFEELLGDVSVALECYTELRISTEGSRLEAVHTRLCDLETQRRQGWTDELVHKWDRLETWYALSEAYGFGRIAREIRKVGPNLMPKRVLRSSIEGPLSPLDEAPGTGSVNGRNFFFELETAAAFSEKGIAATGFDDFRFAFHGLDFHVQCKRLHSKAAIERNLVAACRQLRRRIAQSNERGLVAVALEKVLGLEGWYVPVRDQLATVTMGFKWFESRYRGLLWCLATATPIIGVLLVVRFLTQPDEGLRRAVYYTGVVPLVQPRHPDRPRLERLYEQLGGT